MTTYWTIAEAADFARVSSKRLRHLMANGTLREGIHYTRPRGLRPRFKREAFTAWLEGDADSSAAAKAPPKRTSRGTPAIDVQLLEHVGRARNGV